MSTALERLKSRQKHPATYSRDVALAIELVENFRRYVKRSQNGENILTMLAYAEMEKNLKALTSISPERGKDK